MKAPLLIITILAQVCIVALGAISYDGLVLTSIDVEAVPNTERTVRFSGSIAGRVDDETATFLENVRQINDTDESGKRLFEAETVTVARAREIINEGVQGGGGKPLFCIHGWSTQPGDHLQNLQAARKKFDQGKFTLVPVIWPTGAGLSPGNYQSDQDISAVGAAKAFMTLKKGIDKFPSKSLLCHSMANFVLRNAAFEKFKFDNIFMVAAVSDWRVTIDHPFLLINFILNTMMMHFTISPLTFILLAVS
jgi:pimeloyl-ACP methyl ester carboxylesterase